MTFLPSYSPDSPSSPPPLESNDLLNDSGEEISDTNRPHSRRHTTNTGRYPPPSQHQHMHSGVPERYQTQVASSSSSSSAVAGTSSLTATASDVPPSILNGVSNSNFIRPRNDSNDIDMKEQKTSEERNQYGRRVRPLRPFYVHQWLDILDTQDTWLECQVMAIDPIVMTPMTYTQQQHQHDYGNNTIQTLTASTPAAAAGSTMHGGGPSRVSKILVHYKGFKSKYDEWLDVTNDTTLDMRRRIAPLHTHTRPANTIVYPRPFNAVGDRIDCKDSVNNWLVASVLAIDTVHDQIQVRYVNWSDKFDEWLDSDSYRLQPLGQFTSSIQPVKTIGVGGGRLLTNNSYQSTSTHAAAAGAGAGAYSHRPNAATHSAAVSLDRLAQFQASQANETRFRRILHESHGWDIVDQKEDGNCLFRSVSHQVYGDPTHHNLVRQSAMTYIESERTFFENYIAGETFEQYIERMRVRSTHTPSSASASSP